MNASLLLKVALIVALALFAVSPLTAQEATEGTEECREAAQEWYDAISLEDIRESYAAITAEDARASERFAGITGLSEMHEAIAALDYPSCIESPRQWYLEGLDLLIQALQSALDGIPDGFAVYSAVANGKVGQARGWLAALGVEITDDSTAILLFK